MAASDRLMIGRRAWPAGLFNKVMPRRIIFLLLSSSSPSPSNPSSPREPVKTISEPRSLKRGLLLRSIEVRPAGDSDVLPSPPTPPVCHMDTCLTPLAPFTERAAFLWGLSHYCFYRRCDHRHSFFFPLNTKGAPIPKRGSNWRRSKMCQNLQRCNGRFTQCFFSRLPAKASGKPSLFAAFLLFLPLVS